MSAHEFSDDSPSTGLIRGVTGMTDSSSITVTMLWPAILAVAAVGGSLAFDCVTPFAALAVTAASTLGLRTALGTMAVMWLANQAIGFGALGYPWTFNTVLWGLAIGTAALLATVVASGALHYCRSSSVWLRLPIAFGVTFIAYEAALMATALFLGGVHAFAPAMVGRLALIDAAWLGGLMIVYKVLTALCQSRLGATSQLARAS